MLDFFYEEKIKNTTSYLFKDIEVLEEILYYLDNDLNFKHFLLEVENIKNKTDEEVLLFIENNKWNIKIIEKIYSKIFLEFFLNSKSPLYKKKYFDIVSNNSIFSEEKYKEIFLNLFIYFPIIITLKELTDKTLATDKTEIYKNIKNIRNLLNNYFNDELKEIYLENIIHRIKKAVMLENETFLIIEETLKEIEEKEKYENFNLKNIYEELKKLNETKDKEIFIMEIDNLLKNNLEESIKNLYYAKYKYSFLKKNFEYVLKILVDNYENFD